MLRKAQHASSLVVVVLLVCGPELAQAGRFRRYPGAESGDLWQRSLGAEDISANAGSSQPARLGEPARPAPLPPVGPVIEEDGYLSAPYGARFGDPEHLQQPNPNDAEPVVGQSDTPGQEAPDDDEPESEESEEEESEGPPGLTGYLLHGRDGITAEYIYTGEVFTNTRGGSSTHRATEYLGLFNLALTAELDEMGLLPGGTIFLLFENSHGRGITERHVGDYQAVSNIDGGDEFTDLSEFWWEKEILDGLLRLRLGKQDANADFGVVDLGGDFANSSFGMPPNIPMPAWPEPAMGLVASFRVAEGVTFNAGVFDGGVEGDFWGISGTGEIFTIGELKVLWELVDGRLPGDVHVGMWYHNGGFVDLEQVEVVFARARLPLAFVPPEFAPLDGGDTLYTGNHGVYLGFEQMLLRESWAEDDDQGLGFFLQYSWARQSRSEVPHYYGAGLVYKGLIPARGDDVSGIGMARVDFAPSMELPSDETAIELFYKAAINPYITVQPDLQWVSNPGGSEHDAFVFGLRFEAVL